MKPRILVFLLAAALAAPVGARPVVSPVRHTTVWAGLWGDFLGFVRSFRLFDDTDKTTHGLPPPTCTTWSSFQ